MRFWILALAACAHSVGGAGDSDAGMQLALKDAAPDSSSQDHWQPQLDSGSVQDTSVTLDSSMCGCDLSDPNACMGTVCGWDPQANDSKCGYQVGQGTQGSPCSQQNPSCAPGYVCVTPANKCVHWCKKPNGACPQGSACTGSLQNPPVVCGVTYNVCL